MKPGAVVVVAAAAVILLVPPGAQARSGSEGWQYAVAPYLWAAGIDGSMTVADREADIDVPFDTILDNLDLALMGHFAMRNERWVLSSDLVFVDLESSEDRAQGTATAGLELTLIELAGGYRVSPAVALLGGVRWVDARTSLSFAGEIADEDASSGSDWVDPFVGVHVMGELSRRWWVGARADVGGFGVGCELAWQAYADVGYRASETVSIIVGYHALDMDYVSGGGVREADLDIRLSGPQLGIVFSF
jgi:hypothetical protein